MSILYEYECCECGTVMEVNQKLTDNKLKELNCPVCKSIKPVKKIITSMNFKLVGRGWGNDGYVNTYEQTLADI